MMVYERQRRRVNWVALFVWVGVVALSALCWFGLVLLVGALTAM